VLKRFLSLFRDPDPADAWAPGPPPPFGLVEDAMPALEELAAEGRSLFIRTEPHPEHADERRVVVEVAGATDPDFGESGPLVVATPPGRGAEAPERGTDLAAEAAPAPLPIRLARADRERLAGLVLDHEPDAPPDRGWRLNAPLHLRARETPNPDSRLYLVDRQLTDGAAAYFTPRTESPGLPTRLLGSADIDAVLLRGATLTVERRPGATWQRVDRAVYAALRGHALAAGRPVAGGTVRYRTDLEDRVARLLEERVLPAVRRDGGEIRLLGVDDDGVARVRLVGACRSCPSSARTLKRGVEAVLTAAFPETIRGVEAVE